MVTNQRILKQTPVRKSVFKALQELDHIAIDESRIDELAGEWASEDFELPEWRAPVFPDESTADTSADDVLDFLFVGNSINFSFRDFNSDDKFVAEYNGIEWEGAFGMWACLKRAYERGIPILNGQYLSGLSKKDFRTLFEPADSTPMPMLEERHRILCKVGDQLVSEYNGQFHNFIADCSPQLFANGQGIVDRLVEEFPSFNDTGSLQDSGSDILFYKRAQLAPAMAYGRFNSTPKFEVSDPGAFTVFADYNLPNVLRHLGVLKYDSSLRSTIDNRTLIEAGSRKEIELRVATIAGADLLMESLNQQRELPVYGPHMDYKLFSVRDNVETPVHKTKTTAY